MANKTKAAIHLKDAQLFLDECLQKREKVWITALDKDGNVHHYDGWLVQSSYWRAGTHDLYNPVSRQIRKIRDVLIFEINGHPIYI